jgi:hypothetical protein
VSLPQIIIDVGFVSPTVSSTVFVVGDPSRGKVGGTGLLGEDDVWTDITPYVRTWSVRRGATRGDDPTLRYEPGTCVIELNDGDRRFDPENATGPYSLAGVSQIEPMRRVRIRAIWDGVTYPIFSGFADDWEPAYQGNDWTYTTLSATDAMKVFAANDRDTSTTFVGAGEDSGARIDRILDGVGWSAEDRAIDAGDVTLQSTTLSGNTLTELLLVQDSEQGEFYIDATGRAVFRRRRAMIEDARSTTAQVTFGDGGYYPTAVWNFEFGVGDFSASGATITASPLQAQSGSQSMLLTVVGSPVQAYARQVYNLPVIAGHSYTAEFWVYHPTGATVGAAIDWAGPGGYLSTSYAGTVVAAGVWTELTVTGVAPVGAISASFGPTLDAPTSGTQLFVDSMTLHDDSNELPYADAHPSVGDDGMANTITAARAGGTEQVAQDLASVTKYLVKTYQRLDLLLETDAAALEWANTVKYQFATPARRFSSVDFNTARIDTQVSHWPQVLGREFGDRITVNRRPAGGGLISRDCFVRGVTHESDGVAWRTTFVLQSADRYSFFIVGDAVLGRVGLNALSF